MSKRKTGIALLCGIAGCFLGFYVMRASQERSSGNRSESPPLQQLAESANRGPAQVSKSVSLFSEQLRLERILLSPSSSTGEQVRALREMESKGMDIWSALHVMAKHDPEGYIRFESSVELDPKWQRSSPLSLAFEAVHEKDPDLAEALAVAFPDSRRRADALGVIVRKGLLEGDPEESRRLLAAYSASLSADFFRTWPDTQYSTFAEALAALPNTRHSTEIAHDFARGWFEKDPAAAKRWAMELSPGIVRDFTLGYLLQHMTNQKPDQAAEFYAEITEQFPDWEAGSHVLVSISENLFAEDIAGGIQWAKDHLPVSARADYFVKLAAQTFDKEGADAAMNMLSEIPPAQHSLIIKAIAAKRAGFDGGNIFDPFVPRQESAEPADWPAMIAWSGTLQEKHSQAAREQIATGWASTEIETAKAYVSSPESGDFPQLAEEVAARWASSDPEAAIEWITSLPPGKTGESLERAMRNWSNNQPLAAAEHVLTLPEGNQRAELIFAAGWRLASRDLEGTESWLRSLESDSDKAAARNAMGAAGLENRERLLRILDGDEDSNTEPSQ